MIKHKFEKPNLVVRRKTDSFIVTPHKSGDSNSFAFDVKSLTQPAIVPSAKTVVHAIDNKQILKPIIKGIPSPQIIQKALIIGINYIGTNYCLESAIATSENFKNFLIDNKHFNANDLALMTDCTDNIPTKKSIMDHLEQLIKLARGNIQKQVNLLISYYGHGNDDNDIIIPIDYERMGTISSSFLYTNFINLLPSNVKLTVILNAKYDNFACRLSELKYEYYADDKDTYTVIGKTMPTLCDAVMLISYGIDQLLLALIASHKENISIKDTIINIKNWLQTNNENPSILLYSGKQIDINTKQLFIIIENNSKNIIPKSSIAKISA